MKFSFLISLILLFFYVPDITNYTHYKNIIDYCNSENFKKAEMELKFIDKNSDYYSPALTKLAEVYRENSMDFKYIKSLHKLILLNENKKMGEIYSEKLAKYFREHDFSKYAIRLYSYILFMNYSIGKDEAEAYLHGSNIKRLEYKNFNKILLTKKDFSYLKKALNEIDNLKVDYDGYDITFYEEIIDDLARNPKIARKKMMKFIKLYPNSKFKNKIYFFLGKDELRLKNYGGALNFFHVSYNNEKNQIIKKEIAKEMAIIYYKLYDYKTSLFYFEKSDASPIISSFLNYKLKEYDNSLKLLKKIFKKRKITYYDSEEKIFKDMDFFASLSKKIDLFTIPCLDRNSLKYIDYSLKYLKSKNYKFATIYINKALSRNVHNDGARLIKSIISLLDKRYSMASKNIEILLYNNENSIFLQKLALFISIKNNDIASITKIMLKILTLSGKINYEEIKNMRKWGIIR